MTAQSVGQQARHEHPSLTRIRERAGQLGFACLESKWMGYHVAYAFACVAGHRFKRLASSIVYGRSPAPCPHCEHEVLRQRVLGMAAERGGVCLENDYLGPNVRHRMRCEQGHEWQTMGRKLLAGHWCRICGTAAMTAKLRAEGWHIADLQAKAAARGGQCLSPEYRGALERYEWVCAYGHRWSSVGAEIMRGTWCRLCANRETSERKTDPEGLIRLRTAAQAQGGDCLDEVYLGQSARYRFQCREGHVWKTAGQNVLNGGWCRACHNESRRLGIESMQAVARERGGRCLSETYINKSRRLTWECHHGHVWQTSPRSIFAGHWCPSCAILDRVRSKNQNKRKRYEATDKLDTVSR